MTSRVGQRRDQSTVEKRDRLAKALFPRHREYRLDDQINQRAASRMGSKKAVLTVILLPLHTDALTKRSSKRAAK
jgi:hypothetical protein